MKTLTSRNRGPNTVEGKAIVAQNAVTHAIFAKIAVVPHIENQEEWDVHVTAIEDHFNPETGLEGHLVGRIATTFWRLGRVVRYEHDLIAALQEPIEIQTCAEYKSPLLSIGSDSPARSPFSLGELESNKEHVDEMHELAAKLGRMKARQAVDGASACFLEDRAAEILSLQKSQEYDDSVEDDEDSERTAGELRASVKNMIEMAETEDGYDVKCLLDEMSQTYQLESLRLSALIDDYRKRIDEARQERLLPAAHDLDKIMRYEAHLHRILTKDLHELQRLQAARKGSPMAVPAAVDVTLCEESAASPRIVEAR